MDHTDFINGLRYAFTYKAKGIVDTTLPKPTSWLPVQTQNDAPKRQHVSDAAWERTIESDDDENQRLIEEDWHFKHGVMLVTVEEWEAWTDAHLRIQDMGRELADLTQQLAERRRALEGQPHHKIDWWDYLQPYLVRLKNLLGHPENSGWWAVSAACDEIELLRKEVMPNGVSMHESGRNSRRSELQISRVYEVTGAAHLKNAVLTALADPDPRLGRGNGAMDA